MYCICIYIIYKYMHVYFPFEPLSYACSRLDAINYCNQQHVCVSGTTSSLSVFIRQLHVTELSTFIWN